MAAGSAVVTIAGGVVRSATAGAACDGNAEASPALPVQPSQCVHAFWLWSAGNGIAGAGLGAFPVEQKSAWPSKSAVAKWPWTPAGGSSDSRIANSAVRAAERKLSRRPSMGLDSTFLR